MTTATEDAGAVRESEAATLPEGADFTHLPALAHRQLDPAAAVRAAIKAGLLGVFVGMIPLLGIILTGALAVYFYRRDRGTAPIASVGSRLGGAAGVVSFALNSVLLLVRIFGQHAQKEYIEGILKIAQSVGYNTADPEVQNAVHNLFTPTGMALTFFFGMLFTVALAALGGALATFLMRPGRD